MKSKNVLIIIAITLIIIVTIIGAFFIVTHGKEKKIDNKETSNANNITNNIDNKPIVKYNNKVPIMCYHGVLDDAWGDKSIFVKVAEFDAQMEYLSKQGYTTLFLSEIANANNYEKPIIITFDDGYRDVYTYAFPILKKYNIKANLYVIAGYLNGECYLTTDMLKELSESPLIEIGSHTVNHSVLTKENNEGLEYQLSESKRSLEELTGKKVETIAYPTGAYNNKVIEATKKYYKYALSIEEGTEDPNNLNTYELRRLYMDRDYDIEKFKDLIRY